MFFKKSFVDRSKISIFIFFVFFINIDEVLGRKCVCTSKACKEAGVDICRTRFSCYTEEIYSIDGTTGDNSSTRGCTEGATPLLCETKSWTRKHGSSIDTEKIVNDLDLDSNSSKLQLPWPRLKCCDSHDYCNSAIVDHPKKNDRRIDRIDHSSTKNNIGSSTSSGDDDRSSSRVFVSSRDRNDPIESPTASSSSGSDRAASTITNTPVKTEDREESYDTLRQRIRPLHVAVVVLAIAALTSVLGACYVITRFLRSPFDVGNP